MVLRVAPPFDFIAAIHKDVLRHRKSRQCSPKPNHLLTAVIATLERLCFDDQKIDIGSLPAVPVAWDRKNDGFRVALGYCNLRCRESVLRLPPLPSTSSPLRHNLTPCYHIVDALTRQLSHSPTILGEHIICRDLHLATD